MQMTFTTSGFCVSQNRFDVFYLLDFLADPCEPNPCRNAGVCSQTLVGILCVCPAGFLGNTCQISESHDSAMRRHFSLHDTALQNFLTICAKVQGNGSGCCRRGAVCVRGLRERRHHDVLYPGSLLLRVRSGLPRQEMHHRGL